MLFRETLHTRRLATITATAFGVALLSAGCSGGVDPDSGDATSIRVLDPYASEPEASIVGGALDTCADELGISIERESVPGAELIPKILSQASSRTLPDVLVVDNPNVQDIAQTGALTPMAEAGIATDGFTKNFIEATTYEGEVYGVAPTVNTLGLIYDADALAEAGLQVPTTWDELRDTAVALRGDQRFGMAFSGVATFNSTFQFLPFMWSNGGDETDLTSPEVAEALHLWVDLVESGAASNGVLNWSQGDVISQFAGGQAAMMINGPWAIPTVDAVDGLNWATAPIPVPNAGDEVVAPLGGEAWLLPRTGDEGKSQTAVQLLECITAPDMQLRLAEENYRVPASPEVAQEYVEAHPEMSAFVNAALNARARTAELGTEWPDAATQIYTAIQLALTGQAPAADAFAQAAQQ